MNALAEEDLATYIRRGAAEIDALLERMIEPIEGAPEVLHEAQRYALLAPGKRLRGITVLACAEMLRGDRSTALPLAGAVELVHTSSLILDDLPSMDDATLRRGKATLHRVHGEANAILAAVSLLTKGLEQVFTADRLPAASRAQAFRSLSQAIGDGGLIGGQVADLEAAGTRLELDRLEYIHAHKTGALFIAAAELGALAARAGTRDRQRVHSYAKNLGLAFQITDDLLDVIGDPRTTGKDAGLDSNRTTFVDVCGVDGSHRLVDELIDASCAAVERLGKRAGILLALAEMVRRRDR